MNKVKTFVLLALAAVFCAAVFNPCAILAEDNDQGQTTVLFATSFEAAEGYDIAYSLIGQNGWVGSGSGGNGLVDSYITGMGQQAFIGFSPPDAGIDTLNVWQPINYTPDPTNNSKVRFTVTMAIVDSTNLGYDDFRWSVYNISGDRLFTLDFDNSSFAVSYALDDEAGFVSTGFEFKNSTSYALGIDIDFTRNTWNASLDSQPIVVSQPISTKSADANLGDIDAVWAIRNPNYPGDNYMLFDSYRVALVAGLPPVGSDAPSLTPIGHLPDGKFILRLAGKPDQSYAIEASPDLVNWTSLKTNYTAADGTFDFLDTTAAISQRLFYRARLVLK